MSQPKPICVKCAREMFPERNGYRVRLLLPDGTPYEVWQGDKWRCRGCDKEVVAGFAHRATAHHFQDGFDGVPFDLEVG